MWNLSNYRSLSLLCLRAFVGARITRACRCGLAFSAILWNAASPGSFQSTHTLESKTEKPLIFFFRCLLTRKRTPFCLSLSLSPPPCASFPLALSQLGWRHTWKCWPDSTLGPNLVIQREGVRRGRGGVDGGWGVGRGWKSLPPQDQRQPRLRPPNPTSALYKDLPPHPNFDSHAISQWSNARRKHFHFFSLWRGGVFSPPRIFSLNTFSISSSSLLTLSPICLYPVSPYTFLVNELRAAFHLCLRAFFKPIIMSENSWCLVCCVSLW